MTHRPGSPVCCAVVLALLTTASAPAAAPEQLTGEFVFTPPSCSFALFTDVPASHPYCAWIKQLWEDQISPGCGGGAFCPDQPVTREQLAMLLEKAMRGTSTWDPWRGSLARTLIVSPVPNNPVASGVRLLTAVYSILGSSESNPYLVLVEPGLYDLTSDPIVMPPHATLRGAGRERTVITVRTSAAILGDVGTVIESLTVKNLNPNTVDSFAIELSNGGTVRDVLAVASGGTETVAVRCLDDCTIEDTEARGVAGGSHSAGVWIAGGSPTSAILRRVHAFADDGDNAYGVYVNGADVLVEGGRFEATSAANNWGLNVAGASVAAIVRNLVAEGRGAASTDFSAGIRVESGARLTVENGHLEGGVGGSRYGLRCVSGEVSVHHSRLIGPNGTVVGSANCTIDVAASQLAGAPVDDNGGTVRCALNYSENLNVPATMGCF